MVVMNYEGEYKNCIQQKTAAPTLMLPTMLNWIEKTMNENEEVWRWVHLKYGMSRIMQKLLSIGEKNALSLLLPTIFDGIYKKWMRMRKYEGECI